MPSFENQSDREPVKLCSPRQSVINRIEQVIQSGVLATELIYIPEAGASPLAVRDFEAHANIHLNPTHREILEIWDGLDLEVISLRPVRNLGNQDGRIVFADDPLGFSYGYTSTGSIISSDQEKQTELLIALNLETFILDQVFGDEAASYGGEFWANELRSHGIVKSVDPGPRLLDDNAVVT
jgi:hypothetical protein